LLRINHLPNVIVAIGYCQIITPLQVITPARAAGIVSLMQKPLLQYSANSQVAGDNTSNGIASKNTNEGEHQRGRRNEHQQGQKSNTMCRKGDD
jgi:hypothetical protein